MFISSRFSRRSVSFLMMLTCKCLVVALVLTHPASAYTQLNRKGIQVETNHMTEIRFESQRDYQDPFNEVELNVSFKTPDGKQLIVPAFWAVGKTWIVRYASSVQGDHEFKTVCSNRSDAGLNAQTGKISVVPYTGNNPLYKHGPIRVADDKRHFAYSDGTPFFWLGDTWWMGLTKRLSFPEDVSMLAENRTTKGFNVIQIVAGLYPDMPAFDERGANEAGLPWDTAYQRINPKYFDAADKRIQFLVDQGLVPCIVGGWGYHLPWMGTEKIKKHWRYLIARWAALPVVWCAAGETTMPYYLSKDPGKDEKMQKIEWTKVIRYMRETDGFHRMITTHPSRTARESLTDPSVLDFDMHQSGHGSDPVSQSKLAFEGWNTKPIMPVISGESEYEALEIPLPLPASASRRSFWANAISVGFAGHTYGANGIWQINRKDKIYGNSPGGNNWGTTAWNDAMLLPGAGQIAKGSALIQSLPGWNHLQPHPEKIVSWNGKDTALCAEIGTETIVVYLMAPGTVVIKLPEMNTGYVVKWFDPVKAIVLGSSEMTTNLHAELSLQSPTEAQDWVIVITKQKK